ncbi:MAG: hypothetical protein RL754_956 [Bacteroidota bacterium]
MESIEQSLKTLFIDLHQSGLWADEKAISDSILRKPAKAILEDYNAVKEDKDFDLKVFYETHFEKPEDPSSIFKADKKRSPEEHIDALWPYLRRESDAPERSTRIPLPKPYVVPGGRFQEIYYWDSYFTQLGLILSGKMDWVEDMLDNFAFLIDRFGHIPNGNRTYFLSRSQPPFFALMVENFAQNSNDGKRIRNKYFDHILAEYNFWTRPNRLKKGLAHYHDALNSPRVEMFGTDLNMMEKQKANPLLFQHLRAACESGWDFSSRWLADPNDLSTAETCDILPVDLNSLLYFYENWLFEMTGSQTFSSMAQQRLKSLQTLFFDVDSGFHDYNHIKRQKTPVISAAMLFPLFVNAATELQANVVAQVVRHTLLQPGGLATTIEKTGQQWDAPNGWAPLQWIAVQGLVNYGHDALAEEIAERWIKTCDTIYEREGKFVEKYNVYEPENLTGGGEYELQDGFGWTNGVYLALKDFLSTRQS